MKRNAWGVPAQVSERVVILRSKLKKKCNTGRRSADAADTKQAHEGDSHPTYMLPREAPGIRQAYDPSLEGDDKHYAIKGPDG